ncbi:hypothetical protein QTP86_003673, partial [Hemibagrus guttatus]
EDSFELHSVDLELEAVEKQIRDLQVKQAQLRQRKAALESSRTDAHLSQAQRKDAACPGFVHSGAGVPRSLDAKGKVHTCCLPGARVLDVSAQVSRVPEEEHWSCGPPCWHERHRAEADGDPEEGLQEPGGEGSTVLMACTQAELEQQSSQTTSPGHYAPSDWALEWASAVWDADPQIKASYDYFSGMIKEVFEYPAGGKDISVRLMELRQGSEAAADYAIRFRTLAAQSGWNDAALWAVFRAGLHPALQSELACHEEATTLSQFVATAIRLDNLRRQHRAGAHASSAARPQRRMDYSSHREEEPEPMQLGRSGLAVQGHRSRGQMRLCYHCGASGHLSPRCPERFPSTPVGEISSFLNLTVPASLHMSDRCFPVSALIDSGAAVNLVDRGLVEELGIPIFPCVPALRITAIDSQPIGEGYLKHQTELLDFQVGLFHYERLAFYVTSSPANPVILGFPWLRRHDPHISWRSGELVRWSIMCLRGCLRDPVARPCRTSQVQRPLEAAGGHLPSQYMDFHMVFSEERAACLPHHQVWDCAIDLLPNASPPKGRIYPLSLPESKAMEEYIESSLAAGHIWPSTSPAAAGFFFVGKKDGGLRPCIDYRGLNAVTIRYPYALPLVPAALEQLRGAQVFTKLDLRSAYNLVRIREGDE